MTTPATGAIKFSDVRTATGQSGQISASNFRFRVLANGVNSGTVTMSSCRNKPTAGSVTRSVNGSQTVTIPAYTNLVITVAGAGGGGGTGFGAGWNGSGCVPVGTGSSGTGGNQSSAYDIISYGGAGGGGASNGANGGNNKNANLGGGSPGGPGIKGPTDAFCQGASGTGGKGGDGGYYSVTRVIGSTGPEYLTTATISAGAAGGNGTDGYVTIAWS